MITAFVRTVILYLLIIAGLGSWANGRSGNWSRGIWY